MSSPLIQFSMAPESATVIAAQREGASKFEQYLSQGLRMGLVEMVNHLKRDFLRGGDPHSPRNGQLPIAVRSSSLLNDAEADLESGSALAGYVGFKEGPSSAYARVIMGPGPTTIKPVNANHLWIPIGDNVGANGMAKHSPSWAMSQVDAAGKRLLRFFMSKAGNLIAFLPASVSKDDHGGEVVTPEHGKFKRGKHKGQARGMLMFVLKDEVTIKGTDGLAKAVEDRRPALLNYLQLATTKAVGGAA